jgi:TonB family protein
MGYQALLFCPEEKLARIVGQVFVELDFTVEQVHEPFAAVKKLMSQRYDAIVVDCGNEQNASLLFKSARNSSSNQSSLAIAVVEGQAGVAKAYRIGANLVLTKPINVEQAKGTLRVARGLLRKNSDAANAALQTSTQPAASGKAITPIIKDSLQPQRSSNAVIAASTGGSGEMHSEEEIPPVTSPESHPLVLPAMSAEAKAEDAASIFAAPVAKASGGESFSSTSAALSAAAFAPAKAASAAAVAPAKQELAPEKQEATASGRAKDTVAEKAAPLFASLGNSLGDSDDSSFPSSSAPDNEDSSESRGGKKLLIAAIAIFAVAVLSYFAYVKFGKESSSQVQSTVTVQESASAVPAPATQASPATPSVTTAAHGTNTGKSSANKTLNADKPSAGANHFPEIEEETNSQPEIKVLETAPVHVKSSVSGKRKQNQTDDVVAPPTSAIAKASSSDINGLSGLMASATPVLPKSSSSGIKVSQGVSQGLLIKRVQPKYPQSALAVHAQGSVQIEATINKEGSVINPKVMHGDPILAHAAVEAVRQWRYKPYYLDGEPVEIQTEITITFRAN